MSRKNWHSDSLRRYYASREWRERCRRYWAKHKKQCLACGSYHDIELHHLQYPDVEDHRTWGTEPDDWLVPLCVKDHGRAHYLHEKWGRSNLQAATWKTVYDTKTKVENQKARRRYRQTRKALWKRRRSRWWRQSKRLWRQLTR